MDIDFDQGISLASAVPWSGLPVATSSVEARGSPIEPGPNDYNYDSSALEKRVPGRYVFSPAPSFPLLLSLELRNLCRGMLASVPFLIALSLLENILTRIFIYRARLNWSPNGIFFFNLGLVGILVLMTHLLLAKSGADCSQNWVMNTLMLLRPHVYPPFRFDILLLFP